MTSNSPAIPEQRGKGRKYPPGAECAVEGCADRPRRRWMCQKHWSRWFRHGDPTVAKRPWDDTKKSPYCSWGHDKREVGVYKNGVCIECSKRGAREQHQSRGRRERPIPNLRAVREEFGLSQKQLAGIAGLHMNCIWGLENLPERGARPTTQEKLIRAVAKLRARGRPRASRP